MGKNRSNQAVQQAESSRIKGNMTSALIEVVKEIQHKYRNQEKEIESNDETTRLCSVLESMFIHGLKETFLGRLSSRLALSDMSPKMPEPSFWTFVLVFSHKEVISTVEKLSQVGSEVGRSRAWIRQGLNDGLLVPYLTTMAQDKVSLSVHYNTHAFLRDPDRIDVAMRYLAGLEVYNFKLAVNSSILNRWQPGPLVMAGAWAAPLVQETVDEAAVDIASTLDAQTSPPSSFSRTLAQPIATNSTYIQRGLLNEDEALRLILASTPVAFSISPVMSGEFKDRRPEVIHETEQEDREVVAQQTKQEENKEENTQQNNVEEKKLELIKQSSDDESSQTEPDGHLEEETSANLPGDKHLSSSPIAEPVQAMSFRPISLPLSPRSMSPLSPQRTPSPEWDLEPTTSVPASKENAHDVSCSSLGEEIAVVGPDNWCKRTPEPPMSPSPEPSLPAKPFLSSECSRSPSPEPGGMPPRRNSLSDSSRSSCSSPDHRLSVNAVSNVKMSLSPDLVSAAPDLITQQAERAKRKSVAKVGFQQPPSVMVQQLTLQQNMALLSCLDIVCREQGLDSQDWQCADCTRAIGTIFGSGRVCEYTKKYYCEECHNNTDTAVIPARLLYNWDCSHYKVSRSSLFYLSQVSVKPLIDVRTFNPSLSMYAPALDLIQQQRQRLIYLDAYLSACGRASGEAVKIALAEAVWPREYLYTQTDLYSVRDLEQVHSGEMTTVLSKALKVCLDHVNKCLVCRGRGFICELCRDKKPVYPFDLETTSQCDVCFTVFHSSCSRGLAQCPKCERLEARSLNWHVNNVRLARTGL